MSTRTGPTIHVPKIMRCFFRRRSWIPAVALQLLFAAGHLFGMGKGAPLPQPEPTRQERGRYLKAEFKLLDENQDRQISEAEFERNSPAAILEAERLAKPQRYQPHMISQLYTMDPRARRKFPAFWQIDKNGDSLISYHGEYLGFSSLMFTRFCVWDRNEDGQVTRQEYVASHPPKPKPGSEEVESDVIPSAYEDPKRLELEFALRDRNQDASVTWKEMLALNDLLPPVSHEGLDALRSFVNTDADYDEVISRDEFLAYARDAKPLNKDFLALEENVFRIRDLDGNGALSFLEFLDTGENPARQFLAHDKDQDGSILFDDVKGIGWVVGGKNIEQDGCYFARLDANRDRRVTWKEYRSYSVRGIAFGAIDQLEVDNSISRKEWEAVEREYLAAQAGKQIPPQSASFYATHWFSGIFDLVTFDDLDSNRDGLLSWKEFETFPQPRRPE